jgi:Tfp pilus assembly protein FimT
MTHRNWTDRRTRRPRGRGAFTLAELIMVVSVIILVASITLPGVVTIFTSGADVEAYNLMVAELTAARAAAIQDWTYAGVHVQRADGATDAAIQETFYMGIVVHTGSGTAFKLHDTYGFRPVPGSIAFGEVSDTFYSSAGNYQALASQAQLDDFTSFTVLFSPDGTVVREHPDGPPTFENSGPFAGGADQKIWDNPGAEPGVDAMTVFDYAELKNRETADYVDYLNEHGQLLPVNANTGQLFRMR